MIEKEESRLIEGREYEICVSFCPYPHSEDRIKAIYLGYKEPNEEHYSGGYVFFRFNEDKNKELELYLANSPERGFVCGKEDNLDDYRGIKAYKSEMVNLSEEEKRYLIEINNLRLVV